MTCFPDKSQTFSFDKFGQISFLNPLILIYDISSLLHTPVQIC